MSGMKQVWLGGVAALALIAPSAISPVLAQSGIVSETIVVTAQKREESVLDVPLAITAVTGEFLDGTGITDLDDLSEFVPGFQVQLQAVNTPSFIIRGISSDVSEPDSEPNVSVFYDGIPASRGGGSVIELFDLERVEVAKGPQGTLFSRGASNGAVNFIMRKPSPEYEAMARVEFGNYGSERYEGVVNAPVIEDGLYVRLGAVFHQRDGFIPNEASSDQNQQGKDTLQIRGSFTALPTDDLDVTVIGFWQYDAPDPTGFKTLVPALAEADPFLDDVDPFGEYAQWPGIATKREVYGATVLANYDVSESITVSSTSGYREFQSLDRFDPDGTSIQIIDSDEDDFGRTWFQELRFTFEDEGPFSAFGGVSYYKEEAERRRLFTINQENIFANVLPILFGGAAAFPPIAGLPPVTEDTRSNNETSSYSVFLDGSFDITDRLTFTAGARWTTDDKELNFTSQNVESVFGPGFAFPGSLLPLALSDLGSLGAFAAGDVTALGRFVDSLPANPFSPGNPVLLGALRDGFGIDLTNPASPLFALLTPEQIGRLAILETNALEGTTGGQTLTTDDTFSYFEPRAILEYRFMDGWLAYASYSWGIRSGGVEIEPRAGLTEADFSRSVDEERVTSYEIGLKGALQFDGAFVQLEGAGFYYDYEDFQTLIVQGGSLQNVNAGSASATGFELSANVSFDMGLDLFGNVGYLNGEFDEGSTAAVLGPPIDLSGNDFRLSPDWTISGGVSYSRQLTEDWAGFVSALASYKSEHFFNAENELATESVPFDLREDGYTIVTLNAGLVFDDTWELRGRVENLFDEEYLIDMGNTGRVLGIPTAIRGQPRLYTVGVTARF